MPTPVSSPVRTHFSEEVPQDDNVGLVNKNIRSAVNDALDQKRQPEENKIVKKSPPGNSASELALRRHKELPAIKTFKPSHSRQISLAEKSTFSTGQTVQPEALTPAEELHQYARMRSSSLNMERENSTHTPLTNTVPTRSSAADYEASRAAMISAGIAVDFQELQLERSLETNLPAKDSKIFLGSGGTSNVFAVKLDQSYDHYGETFVFKQVLDSNNLPAYIRASLQKLDGAQQKEALKQELLHTEKRKIVSEYSHHAAVNYIAQIPKVHGLFELDGAWGILMERISGPDLSRLQPLAQTAAILGVITPVAYFQLSLRSIADTLIALGEMHERNLTQSDIKPGNVMWDSKSTMFKLMDHGGARQTGEKARVFTPGYGELSSTSRRDMTLAHPYSDIHQAGQTLHFMLTGKTINARQFDNAKEISLISILEKNISAADKQHLADLLNGMISPEIEGQNNRKPAKELLKNSLFASLDSRENISKTLAVINNWSEGE